MLFTIIKNLISRPVTRRYPFKDVREPVDGYRGKIAFELTNCKLCGACSRLCPAKAIEINRPGRQLKYYLFNCIYCGSCIDACPSSCIRQETHYTPPSVQKELETYDVPASAAKCTLEQITPPTVTEN
jgi:ech hydrogenase subunit F